MKTSIKYLICTLLAIVTAAGAFAQNNHRQGDRRNNDEWREKMQNEKIAFLTSEINLTVEEAQAFWPVYNEVQKNKQDAFKDVTASFDALKNAIDEGKTGKEIEVLLNAYFDAKEDCDAIDRQSIEKYKKIISEEKIAKLILGEEKFRHQQIRRLNRDDTQGQGRPRGGENNGYRGGNRGGNRGGGWSQMNMEED